MIFRHSFACAFVSIWVLSFVSLSSSVAAHDATSLTSFCGSSNSNCRSCHHHCCCSSCSAGSCHRSQRSSSSSTHLLERRRAISDRPDVSSSISLVPSPAPTPHPQAVTRRSLQVPLSSLPHHQVHGREKNGSPVIPISKTQLEQLLGSLTDTTFQLDVLQENDDKQQQQQQPMGRIPVHIHVQDLKVGGLSLPMIGAESWNDKLGPINFGNIELWRG
ncbi:MAG: hypothetical protein J3Q66DRAFT_143757 [Benniella sp.]|nr:MAG: hypothetical protein J3Q66DRAFT_143757 [Benniella sp.]